MAKTESKRRVVLVSWSRPSPNPYVFPVGPWVERLCERLESLKTDDPDFDYIDLRQGNEASYPLYERDATVATQAAAISNKADVRDRRSFWTDFLALYTLNYEKSRNEHELAEVLRHCHEDTDRTFWVAKLDPNNLTQKFANLSPVHDASRWHVLPAGPEPEDKRVFHREPDLVDDEIYNGCIVPLSRHGLQACPSCEGRPVHAKTLADLIPDAPPDGAGQSLPPLQAPLVNKPPPSKPGWLGRLFGRQ
ncbi:MAG: hypothetical protein EKK47_06350 [Burkholderiales bacterium]|nr:MAG: hypothetical protein EKK47_06350 [Burkholderiales bacterium]